MFQPRQGLTPWPDSAVHDTVAAIARQAEFQRTLSETLMHRLGTWILRLLNDFFELVRGSATGQSVTIALVVLLLVLVAARIVVAARAPRDATLDVGSRTARARGADPWSEAERLAAAGHFTEAAHALLAALLLAFASRGEVRLHASKTAGDYARELRRRGSPAQGRFRVFRSRYERIIYGDGECGSDDYAGLLEEARLLRSPERPGARAA